MGYIDGEFVSKRLGGNDKLGPLVGAEDGAQDEGALDGSGDGAGDSVGSTDGKSEGADVIVGELELMLLGSTLGEEDTLGGVVLGVLVDGVSEGAGVGWVVSVGWRVGWTDGMRLSDGFLVAGRALGRMLLDGASDGTVDGA